MAEDPQLCIPMDHLHAFSGIALAPSKIRASSNAQLPSDPNGLDSLHNFMKSLESRRTERASDNAIFNRDTELVNSKFGQFLDTVGVDKDAMDLEGKEQPQRRREWLGCKRKRARFSLQPVTSQASDDLVPSLNIDQLQDPIDFFSAVERRENAIREIRMLKSETAPHLTNYDPLKNRQRRRPGLTLGKTASYKHQYSSAIPELDDMCKSSPVLPGSHDELLQGTNTSDPEKEEIDVEETENNEILDELLSKRDEDLDGDGGVSLLQELLQFKPIDVGSLSVPDFHDFGRTKFKALTQRGPRTRKVLSNITNLVNNLTPKKLKQGMESPLNSTASPTPPRSPLASLSLVERQSLQSSTQRDPSLPLHVDLPGRIISYPGVDIEEESLQVSALNEPSMTGSVIANMEDDTCRPQLSDIDMHTARHDSSTDSALAKNRDLEVIEADASPQRSDNDMLELHAGMNLHGKNMVCDPSVGNEDDTEKKASDKLTDVKVRLANMEVDTWRPQLSDVDIHIARHDISTDSALDKNINQQVIDTDASPQRSENDMLERHAGMSLHGKTMACDPSVSNEDATEKVVSAKLTDAVKVLVEALPSNEDIAKSACSSDMYQCSHVEGNLEEIVSKECYPAHQATKVHESGSMNALEKSHNLTNEVIDVAVEGNHTDMLSTIGDINEEQHLQKQICKMKRSRGTQRISNAHPFPPSLAAAGTSFESGVRRSKRIKTRPLEYWKGERLLYGRVNECLELVGLKYISSPAKGGGKLKVKSYVSDEYNAILELAAVH